MFRLPTIAEQGIRFVSSSSASRSPRAPASKPAAPKPPRKETKTMPRVPLVGRLRLQEHFALVLSFLFLLLESLLRVITLALPTPIINFCYHRSRTIFNFLSSKSHTTTSSPKKIKDIVAKVREADGFLEICDIWNDGSWLVEEHVVQTKDGYLLGLHRIVKKDRNGRSRSRVRDCEDRGNGGKKVVYLHHGLLMNSEVWVCLLKKEKCLPFVLADKGYDVWLGNNRGNKYSKKSIHHPSSSPKFWDFSMDDFAFHDIPDSINYILDTTKRPSLSYIGFSQGTAQAFATLSIHPALNDRIDAFIALAPAMSPERLSNTIVDALMKTSPNIMFLFFGRKSILSSATFWQSILYPPIFVRIIDYSVKFLFGWKCNNISLNQKIAAYSHLYSFTSVKSVVHWFQIIRNKSFQMYDDDVHSFTGRNFYKVAKFPTRNITAPVVLVYGGSDSLVDISVMLRELPSHTIAKEVKHYEHLDFLWANDVDELVFPHVLEALDTYSAPSEDLLIRPGEENLTLFSVTQGGPPTYSEDERTAAAKSERANGKSNSSAQPSATPKSQVSSKSSPPSPISVSKASQPSPAPAPKASQPSPAPAPKVSQPSPVSVSSKNSPPSPVSTRFRRPSSITTPSTPPREPSTVTRVLASPLTPIKPEVDNEPPPSPRTPRRTGSISSIYSASAGSGGIIGPGGITLGSGRPVAGVSTGAVEDAETGTAAAAAAIPAMKRRKSGGVGLLGGITGVGDVAPKRNSISK